MPEPLTEEQLREYRELATALESYFGPGLPLASLLDEVDRLRARNAVLEADFAMRNIAAMQVLDHDLIEEEEL